MYILVTVMLNWHTRDRQYMRYFESRWLRCSCAGAGWTSAGLGTRQGEAAVTAVDAVSYVCTVLHQHGDSVV